MKTIIHQYQFYLYEPSQKQAYLDLVAKLSALGLSCFESWGGESHYNGGLNGRDIELEDDFIFANQWNTKPLEGKAHGLRVFDWAQDYKPHGNVNLKQGHWVEQTEEMKTTRAIKKGCGYCGAQYWPTDNPGVFCNRCLGSDYLKEKDLYLLRLLSVTEKDRRSELTESERAELMPAYVEAQTRKTAQQSSVVRVKLLNEYHREKRNADAKYLGTTWLLDHNVNIHNCIYYDHTGVFSFGWRSLISDAVKSALLDVLCEFPYPYEIKSEQGVISTVETAGAR